MANWAWGYGDADDDDNEEEEFSYQTRFGGRDGLIFLIDCTKPMFERHGDEEESHFDLCIKCARSVLSNKIISSDRDLIGVVLFGTTAAKNDTDFKHIYILQELEQPCAARILELEEYLDDSNNNFAKNIGHSMDFQLSDALWTCSHMFSNSEQKIGHKRVMLFTNNDNPHAGDTGAQRQAKTKAKDLNELGIDLDLMHMQSPGRSFDLSKFYQDVIFVPDDEDVSVLPDPAEKFEELLSRVRSKDHKKRSQGRVTFKLGEGLEMAVSLYNLVRATTKSTPINLDKKTNEPVQTKSSRFSDETGEKLMPSDVKKFQKFGGRRIIFDADEVTEIKKFGDPGMVLMGFKPRSSLKRYHHVRPAQFIHPDENSVTGSTSLFSALLQKCVARDVIAICKIVARKNSPPRFVALLPQEEELDDHNVQLTPAGFHVIFLPFCDDIRKLKYESAPKANTDQVDKAKEMVKKLQFTYRSEAFENPSLQTHYRNLEALALDRDVPDDVPDYTEPNNENIKKRAGRIIQEFKELVFPDGYDPDAPPAKRKLAGGGGGAAKKPKVEIDVSIEDEAKAGRLGKLTVPVLKDFCKSQGLTTAGKKQDLIATINQHFGL
ncbi:X-ray repair cross-complementing protein 6-like [Ptychodera flava]|uniref:X-ray repair cross-complementing protein 6-like n=1 Tax=Ptychodera flava TaxID=63121 RepID=UPI00396A3435